MHQHENPSAATLFAAPSPPPTQHDAVQALFDNAAELFAALSCPTRLRIVCELRHGEQTVHRLVQSVHCSQPNVSRHLRLLRRAGIVRCERSGNAVTYHLSSAIVDSMCGVMCAH